MLVQAVEWKYFIPGAKFSLMGWFDPLNRQWTPIAL